MNKKLALIGAALGWGAQKIEAELGPLALQQAHLLDHLKDAGIDCEWRTVLEPTVKAKDVGFQPFPDRIPWIIDFNQRFAQSIDACLKAGEFPILIGGDHSMAVGTWSGVVSHFQAQGEMGLLWVDAHMDSHTPETSPSHAVHGMPLASLLGYGMKELTDLYQAGTKLIPEYVTLLGVRSYEEGEAALLKKLGVRIFFMDEVRERGLEVCFKEAIQIVSRAPKGFGISLDLDAFDSSEVPGVGTPEKGGISPSAFYPLLQEVMHHEGLKALEIAEFNPPLDVDHKTEKVIEELLKQLR